jgi:hypothetical protein
MLSGIIVAVQESHTKLQESVMADISSVRADLIANQESGGAELSANQERVMADINSIRNDIKAENEKLIKKFELWNQEAKKESAAKLDSEARRLTSLVGQVRKDTESELLAVKRQIQAVSTEFKTRIVQSSNSTQGIVDELASQIVDHRPEVDIKITKLGQDIDKLTRQRESIEQASIQEKSAVEIKFDQLRAKIIALENKVSEFPTRSAVVAEPCAVDNLQSPSVVN